MAGTPKTLVSAAPRHYVWWFPGSPVKIHLDLQVVQRLQQQLCTKGTGASEEGLLFGSTRDGTTEIREFQPVGNATARDMVAALPPESQCFLMGYYRTEKGDTFHLEAKDHLLAAECFAKSYQVFLMIHANGFAPPNATFFFHEGDRRMTDFAFLEFPFDSSLLAVEEQGRMQRSLQAIVKQPLAPPSPATPLPARNRRRDLRGFLLKSTAWTCFVGLVFALGILSSNGGFREWYSHIWSRIPPARPIVAPSFPIAASSSHPSLALRAIRQNGDLELTWDRASPLIAAATSGVISIQDGESKRLVPLDFSLVRGGSLLYSPTSDQVVLKLSVTTPADTATESVIAILPPAGRPHVYSVEPKLPSGSRTPPSDSIGEPTKLFTAPLFPTGAPSPEPPALRDPPVLGINPLDLRDLIDLMPGVAPPPQPIPTRPQPIPTRPPQRPNPVIATYEPPVAIVKVSPVFPAELQKLIVQPIVVQIKVNIGENGKVIQAEAIPRENVNKLLLNSAAHAAYLWKFQPARRNHEPVASEMILQFVFRR